MNARLLLCLAAFCALLLPGCETLQSDSQLRRQALEESIRNEPPGDYYIGRRMYKKVYKMWGWIRKPGQPWSTAKLVMLNEQKCLAPDRAANTLGSDNDFEYVLHGYFSGDSVYEPASDGIYPEFVLTSAEIRSTSPPLIYREQRETDPEVRVLLQPL